MNPMKRDMAYAALATELETWRLRAQSDLVLAIGQTPVSCVVETGGEEVVVEIAVSWATDKRKALKITGRAYGSSHLFTERLEEALLVPLAS